MAWGDVGTNQMVSYADALTSPFTLNSGQTNPGTLQCMTKSNAFTLYNLAANADTNALSSNQLMQKSFWQSGVVGNSFIFGTTGSASSSESCALGNTGLTLYSASTTLGIGTKLFYDAGLTNQYYNEWEGDHWIHSGTKAYRVDNYYPNSETFDPQIRGIFDCTPPVILQTLNWSNYTWIPDGDIGLSISGPNTNVYSYTTYGNDESGTTVYGQSDTLSISNGVESPGDAGLLSLYVYSANDGLIFFDNDYGTSPYIIAYITTTNSMGTITVTSNMEYP